MKSVLCLCVILIYCSVARPQEKRANATLVAVPEKHCAVAADEAALSQIAERWKDGYNNGRAAEVASLYAEDATYLTQHFVTGIVQGRAAIQAYVQRGVDAGYHIDSIQVLATECSGDFAYTMTLRVHQRRAEGVRCQRRRAQENREEMAHRGS
jgi:ketosteroid isomerase-like protein